MGIFRFFPRLEGMKGGGGEEKEEEGKEKANEKKRRWKTNKSFSWATKLQTLQKEKENLKSKSKIFICFGQYVRLAA